MKTYTVKEVAEMLDTNPETVRRWIRSGKLKAEKSSRKDGNVIQEDDLYKYLRGTSKYAGVAAGMVLGSPLLAVTSLIATAGVGVVAALASAGLKKNNENIEIFSDDVKKTLEDNISESKKIIESKKSAISELQAEINREQQKIEDCNLALEHLSDAVNTVERNPNGKRESD
ncbi:MULTISPECIES: helix-turn-helix domain-containing protein [Clostridia]|uniref:helix-turn-helix domain-containing protein n=1 Tax=Clostridia TaxID=186801 RepID=UPI0008323D13|nr:MULTISPECIES: helix-turn-helix domain-containing protein [Clostridia]